MKKAWKLLSILFVFMAVLCFAVPCPAYAAQSPLSIDFEDGTFASLGTAGIWRIAEENGNKFAKTEEDLGLVVTRLIIGTDIADFDIAFDVLLKQTNHVEGKFGISARRSEGGNDQYDIFYNSTYEYFDIKEYCGGDNGTRLGVYQEPEKVKIEQGQWYTIGVRIKENTISWYQDGQLVLSVTDAENPRAAGELQLYAYAAGICIDNIKYGAAESINMETGEFVSDPIKPDTNPNTNPSDTNPPKTENPPETADYGISAAAVSVLLVSAMLIAKKRYSIKRGIL